VLPAQFHDLTAVTMLAFHTPPTYGVVIAVPLFVYCGGIPQPTEQTFRTVVTVPKDVAKRGQHNSTNGVLIGNH
jgi:hypothetical protein